MHKVFVCLVADLSYSVDTGAMDGDIQDMIKSRAAVLDCIGELHDAMKNSQDTTLSVANLGISVEAAEAAADTVIGTADGVPAAPFEVLTLTS
eukprot:2021064-Prymnesium_polylepis.1